MLMSTARQLVSTSLATKKPANLKYYQQIRDPKAQKMIYYTPQIVDTIVRRLQALGFRVEDLTLDPLAYRSYFAAAGYSNRYPFYYRFNLSEKSLEHFVAAQLLELGPSDVYIDIASARSPVPEIYTRLFCCTSYRQDLAYPAGLKGDRIGGDAAAMPVPDGFASKMGLHCSFEHFEGDSDIRFIREVERVLRSGGKVVFAPLYLFQEYAILTDPAVAVAQRVSFESDAVVYARPGWRNRHGRFYDPDHLDKRIKTSLGAMRMTIYRITNATDVHPSCYIQFAAMITKP
jgi:SAM-dependent methyltransferase